MTTHPEVLWAQRSSPLEEEKNVIYLTVNLVEIDEFSLQLDLNPTSISFKAKARNADATPEKEYAFSLQFYDEIIPEKSKKSLTTRHLALVLQKKENKADYWPRLSKEKVKLPFIKTDFSKWVDEDEQDGEPVKDEDMGRTGMDGMGMDGMGGMDFEQLMKSMPAGGSSGEAGGSDDADLEDSDDDGPPPLEDGDAAK